MKYKKDKDNIKALHDPEMDEGYEVEHPEKKKKHLEYFDEKKSNSLSIQEQKELAKQVDIEYKYCEEYSISKREEFLKRLKIYNNQKRDKNRIGDPHLFTVFQTVLASLYSDTLTVEFKGREEGDYIVASNLNDLAKYDYEEMGKNTLDYDWDWDAMFFGRGIIEFTHFDRKKLTPIPQVVDPTVFLRDPRATSVRGDRLGNGSMRFGGLEIAMTYWKMKQNPAFFNLERLKDPNAIDNREGGDFDSLLQRSRQERAEAQNNQDPGVSKENDLGDNAQFDLLKWYTYFKGRRCVVYLANGRTDVVRYHSIGCEYFPLFDRPMYPTAHDWDGTSIPDLVEDKQRARSIIQNAMLDNVKADLNPMYIYNTNKIKNRADLNFGFNKHVPVDGDVNGAVMPMAKASTNSVTADYILQTLDAASQKATATPEIQQGAMSDQQRTLGELNLIASKSSTRYSLSATVFGWSEKAMWQHWYWMYKNYMNKEVDEKIIRVSGAWGDKYRKLTKDQIISEIDPDVTVTSTQMSEAENIRNQMRLEKFISIAVQDPTMNKRYSLKKLGKSYGLKPDELDRMFPPTADELIAINENTIISENKMPEIKDNDNHVVHLEMHAMAAETKAKTAHMYAHKEALRLMRENPNLFPGAAPEVFQQAGMTPPGGLPIDGEVPVVNQNIAQEAGSEQVVPAEGLI